jgi:hypothetical protein
MKDVLKIIAQRDDKEWIELTDQDCRRVLGEIIKGERELSTLQIIPEITPIPGEVWKRRQDKYVIMIFSKQHSGAGLFGVTGKGDLFIIEDKDEMIHGQNDWELVWSPDPERMKSIKNV